MDIITSRLSLLPLRESDYDEIHTMNSYAQVAQYNTIGIPEDIGVTKKLLDGVLRNEQSLVWVIRTLEDATFVGEIGMNLSAKKYRKSEIYYSLHPDQWGNGYAMEGVQAIINYGFSELNLHRIQAGVAVENIRSISLLERLGMTREGLCRKILPLQSGWSDNYMYAILEEDPRDY
ncbi:MAG: GNAT family N-acetyltransferase [Bacteroidota bacterium]